MKVVADKGLRRVSNGTDHGFVASDNIADLNDCRRILRKERRFDEAVLEQQCQTHVDQARGVANTPGTACNPCHGILQTGLRPLHHAARIGCGRQSSTHRNLL